MNKKDLSQQFDENYKRQFETLNEENKWIKKESTFIPQYSIL